MTRSKNRVLRLASALLLWAAPEVARGQEPAPAAGPRTPAAPTSPAATPAPAATPPPAAASAPAPEANGHSRTGKISGTVTDVMRHALAGFLVRLESRSDPGTLRVTSTDLKGMYHFKDLPPGIYDVHVEADGFGPGSKERIDVRPPFQNIVDVALARAASGAAGTASPATVAPGSTRAGEAAAGEAATEPVIVRGRFADTEGRPEVEVSVLLVEERGSRLYQAFSAADGTFAVEGVTPGRYRMLVRSTGHMTIDLKSVDVRAVNGLNISLALVDFPLDTHPHASAPPEIPRPLPAPAARTPPAAPPAPPAEGRGATEGVQPAGPDPAEPAGGGAPRS